MGGARWVSARWSSPVGMRAGVDRREGLKVRELIEKLNGEIAISTEYFKKDCK